MPQKRMIDTLKAKLWQAWKQASVSPFQAKGMFQRYEEIDDIPAWIANCLHQNYSFFEYRQMLKIQRALRQYHRATHWGNKIPKAEAV